MLVRISGCISIDRELVFQTGCCGFDSHHPLHLKKVDLMIINMIKISMLGVFISLFGCNKQQQVKSEEIHDGSCYVSDSTIIASEDMIDGGEYYIHDIIGGWDFDSTKGADFTIGINEVLGAYIQYANEGELKHKFSIQEKNRMVQYAFDDLDLEYGDTIFIIDQCFFQQNLMIRTPNDSVAVAYEYDPEAEFDYDVDDDTDAVGD